MRRKVAQEGTLPIVPTMRNYVPGRAGERAGGVQGGMHGGSGLIPGGIPVVLLGQNHHQTALLGTAGAEATACAHGCARQGRPDGRRVA
jgi:hypothetical protein